MSGRGVDLYSFGWALAPSPNPQFASPKVALAPPPPPVLLRPESLYLSEYFHTSTTRKTSEPLPKTKHPYFQLRFIASDKDISVNIRQLSS